MADALPPAVFLDGTYGVGKSAVLDHLGDLLAAEGTPFALMDVDGFHRSWPTAPGDPDNVLVEARAMAATWAAYRTAGPRQLVVSGVLAERADLDRYREALGVDVRCVRLTASDAVVEARLRSRYDADRAAALDWHLARFRDLAARQERAGLAEAVVATDGLAPREVARRVRAALAF
ncbi:hypothetical protein FGG90_13815 [Clavibacter tessellarius]|uniref:Uncharacterized protein n=1 Tax=Clavibacter tessellarius TaxID=31965 RepID=A0A225CBG1_9MICO|nr:AAA family ATPase [Clavibacter michiganensis]OQJ62051.1 hypothetical protein B5P24_02900 [Clavibacter michiganensis subsp. tessellarius]UKF34952.1 hypothetical protein FGG90_13815 [Clavibacter michiganensis subsp. tessellarius]